MLVLYFLLAALGGYLLGSIPFGYVLARAAGIGDIRSIGSGNIGATNVLRTGRKDLALATLVLDAAKAGAALLIARALAGDSEYQMQFGLVAGAAAFLGHCFPVWLNFRGGKGVATYFGVMIAGMPPLGLAAGVVWLAIAVMFRMSSLSALVASGVAPILGLIAGYEWTEIAFMVALAAMIFWRHAGNIARIRAGTEPKIGERKPAPTPDPAPETAPPQAAPDA